VFLFLIIGTLLVLLTLLLSKVLSPKKPSPEKLLSYECGEEPEGSSWIQFNPRFYVIALVFLLFDVEMAFIFPWATVFGQETLIAADARWGWFTLVEMFIFIGILILGLVYVWRKGDLEWIRPQPVRPQVKTAVPLNMYEQLNAEKYSVKPFKAEQQPAEETKAETTAPAPRPAFKPVFRKAVQK